MADISVEKKKGGDLTWVWAIGAVVAIVALMVWLYSTKDTVTQVVTTDADSAEVAASTAETVELATAGAAPDQYAGRVIRVENVPVAVTLGNRSFWAEVTGANPILVVVGPAAPDVSFLIAGTSVHLEGTIDPLTEELLTQWVTDGQTMQPAARDQAAFATHYFNATVVEPATAAAAPAAQ